MRERAVSGVLAIDSEGNAGMAYNPSTYEVRLRRFSARGRFLSDVPLATIPRKAPWYTEPLNAPTVASLSFDHEGNALICGTFSDYAATDFDASQRSLTLEPRTTDGKYDGGYLAKYTPAGRPIFAEALNSEGNVRVAGAGVDRLGNIHVAGSFDGKVDLNPSASRVFIVDAGQIGKQDLFEATYDGEGKFVSGESVRTPTLDEEAYFFGLAPGGSTLKAAVIAVVGPSIDESDFGLHRGMSVFAE
jgi:hypothetical protein